MNWPRFRTAGALFAVALVSCFEPSCSRRVGKFVEESAEPPSSKEPVQIPSLAAPRIDPRTLPMAQGGGGRRGPGGAMDAAAGPAEDTSGQEIQGTVVLGKGQRGPDQGVLFVFACATKCKPGTPPIAAKRLPIEKFPLEFTLGPNDRPPMMGAKAPFQGPLELAARIDIDGNATTRSPGELSGSREGVKPGDKGVEIVLGE